MAKLIRRPLNQAQIGRLSGVAKADAQGLRGNGRDDFVKDFEQGFADGVAEERARWAALMSHPAFTEQAALATELYARTGDLAGAIAALELDPEGPLS